MVATQQFAPARQPVGLALQQPPADHTVTAQQGAGDVFQAGITVIGCRGFAQQRPAPGIVHATEQGAATTTMATVLPLARRGDQRAQASEAVGADQACGHQLLQGVFQFSGEQVGIAGQFIEKQSTVFAQRRVHPLRAQAQFAAVEGRAECTPQVQLRAWQQHQRCAAQGGAGCAGGQACPHMFAGATALIQPARAVVADPAGQQIALPGGGRCRIALELAQHFAQRCRTLQVSGRCEVLPVEQKTHEILQADRLDFAPQAFDRVAMDARQQVALAPLQALLARTEVAAHHVAFCLKPYQRLFEITSGQVQRPGDLLQCQWTETAQARAQHFHQRGLALDRLVEPGKRRKVRCHLCRGIECAQEHLALAGQPQGMVCVELQAAGPTCCPKFLKPRQPARVGCHFSLADTGQAHQCLVHFIAARRRWPGFGLHCANGLTIQGAEVIAVLRIAPASTLYRLGTSFFQRCIIEKGVGPGVENRRGQRRWRRQVTADQADLPSFDAPQQGQPAFTVHGLVQTVVEGLLDQWVIRDLPFADDVFQAGDLVGEHRGNQVLAFHPLDLRRHLAPADKARQGQRHTCIPAPAHAEQRRIEQGLDQYRFSVVARQIAPYVVQHKAVAGGQ
ncbi:hypothetical protein D3C80_803290 [compost metagenome]